ncbi:MAG: Rnf-Nqr domain containing protein, partial [Anaerococcus hydrogenalis]|nr:Rnf-Nqr domain containing protein [Anaerococcus hydrogenalis]
MERQTGKPIDVQKEKEKRKKKSPNLLKVFKDGIFSNNPVFVQMVGMCSVLAISSSLSNAIGMGAAVIFVLTLSNLVISLLRNFIPDEVRIPAF